MSNATTTAPDLTGYAFPLIVVKYHGATASGRGSRHVATLKQYQGMSEGGKTVARVSEAYDHATGDSEQRMSIARACWAEYAAADEAAPVLVPVAMWDGSTGYAVVPAYLLGGAK